jgi:hypothetical protein
MPPHCDSLDGPVVPAARQALDAGDVDLVLPYVDEAGEDEVQRAFELVTRARAQGADARELAGLFFFETVVRTHRAGEGAPYTGLKPSGLDVGPAVRRAEAAVEAGSPEGLADFLATAVRRETVRRFEAMRHAAAQAASSVAETLTYVHAVLGLQVWAHRLYDASHAVAHEADGAPQQPVGEEVLQR